MNRHGRVTCLVGAAAAIAMMLLSGTSQASAAFPGEIASRLGMPCPPPCNLCHISPQGGDDLQGDFVGAMLLQGGLLRARVETVAPALGVLDTAMPPVDTDMDGTEDVDELRQGRNPNLAPTSTESDVFACPPTYGCGARIAPRPPIDGSALALALVVAGYLALRSRRSA